ncbi:MAG: hypothetical protein QM756_25590 [Polyangiaceae bacterium]
MSRYLLAAAALVGLSGCGTSVAQTAVLESDAPLECVSSGALSLPRDAVFGDGSEPASNLVGSLYHGGQGPGLYVAARDAYRVYLNGRLVRAAAAPREATFIPLSLLPGDNALSVVVAAKRGTPAALLQLDELDQSYVSDASWKVSSAPTAGFTNAGYDDSAWSAATDFGALSALPGCAPSSFGVLAGAHWIGPSSGSTGPVVLRKLIRILPVGYGAAARGGGALAPSVVDDWDDLSSAGQRRHRPSRDRAERRRARLSRRRARAAQLPQQLHQ